MTSDHKEFCERLRKGAWVQMIHKDEYRPPTAKELEAAALIESQSARIAELEAQITSANDSWMELYGALTKRYEELEAQLADPSSAGVRLASARRRIEELESQIAEAKQGEAVGYFLNCAAEGEKPHYLPVGDEHKDHEDVIALYAHPPAASDAMLGLGQEFVDSSTAESDGFTANGAPPAQIAEAKQGAAEQECGVSTTYCRDCKHFSGVHFAECRHPDSPRDMVYGWTAKASVMRKNPAGCGVDARLFEPREAPSKKVRFFQGMFGK
jgi:hypothetical protein